ncbi:MAG: metallophosphoesterase family protein [Chloroflexi bacterium]|jgi:predicted phosphodiesterase|nr:metallophosphoesterase family protein [Chloroflexota bacterium]
MKIAVLADIHANLIALQAVSADIEAWNPDLVIVAGDIVNRGPRPAECLRFIQEKQASSGWQVIRGNHEDYVISQTETVPNTTAWHVHRASYWTYQQLNGGVAALQAMPFEFRFDHPEGGPVCAVHGSLLGIRDGIYPETPDEDLPPRIGADRNPCPALFCVGHTHRPLVRTLGSTLVVNAGSAGLPFDGDTRPSYARIVWHKGAWQASIVRVPYDLQKAEQDFYDSGYTPDAGPLVKLVIRELRTGQSMLYNWAVRYQQAALRGEISMEESVRRILEG